jgi:hypothetical protein
LYHKEPAFSAPFQRAASRQLKAKDGFTAKPSKKCSASKKTFFAGLNQVCYRFTDEPQVLLNIGPQDFFNVQFPMFFPNIVSESAPEARSPAVFHFFRGFMDTAG